MARYLITSGAEVMGVVEAKSVTEAVEGMNIEGEGEVTVYTVTSQRTLRFETVRETHFSVVSSPEAEEEE